MRTSCWALRGSQARTSETRTKMPFLDQNFIVNMSYLTYSQPGEQALEMAGG